MVRVKTNPLGKIPVFTALTHRRPVAERHRIGRIASSAVVVILLKALGITIPAFRIAGSILLLLSALTMMSSAHEEPLATPLLAGPGAISTVGRLRPPR